MVEEGRVTVNGELPAMGQKILPGDQVEVDGTMVGGKDRPVLLWSTSLPGSSARQRNSRARKTLWTW